MNIVETTIPCPFCAGSGLFGTGRREYLCLRCGSSGWMSEADYQFYLEGQEMKAKRLARGESVTQMAERLGIEGRAIYLRENGWRREPIKEIAKQKRSNALRMYAEATA